MTDLYLFGITTARRKGKNLFLLKIMAENTGKGKQLLETIEDIIKAQFKDAHFNNEKIKLVKEHVGYHNKGVR